MYFMKAYFVSYREWPSAHEVVVPLNLEWTSLKRLCMMSNVV